MTIDKDIRLVISNPTLSVNSTDLILSYVRLILNAVLPASTRIRKEHYNSYEEKKLALTFKLS